MDYMSLPPPVRYEELQREVMSESPALHQFAACKSCCTPNTDADGSSPAVSLKPDLFEGLRFEFSKPLNQNFAFTHRCVSDWRLQFCCLLINATWLTRYF